MSPGNEKKKKEKGEKKSVHTNGHCDCNEISVFWILI